MLKEYFDQLEKENFKNQQSYEEEMRGLKANLSSSEKFLAQLEREKEQKENVFSPRAHDSEIDKKICESKAHIQQLSQQIDHVSQLIKETEHLQEEYKALKQELNSDSPVNSELQKAGPSSADSRLDGSPDFKTLVNEVCKKIDLAISLMSGNKNRSKAELKNAERLLRNFVQKDCS